MPELDIKVSIVTVSFNSENTVSETIESVLGQTYSNIEYIIVDGLSCDRTVEIAKNYSEQFAEKGISYRVISEKDSGIFDAMNKGIALAQGELIGIINSDDFYALDAIEKSVALYKRDKYDAMYADLRIFGAGNDFIKKAKYTRFFTTRKWNHPTMFVAKKVYDSVNYREDDLDFILRLRKNKYKISVLNDVTANFRLGGVSNKKTFKQCLASAKRRNAIYKKNGFRCVNYWFDNYMIEIVKYFATKR